MTNTTYEKRAKRNKMIVIPAMVIGFCICLWFIFKPDITKETVKNIINSEIPTAENTAMVDDKRKAYEQEAVKDKQRERGSLASMFNKIKPEQAEDINSEPYETIKESAKQYNDINRHLTNFYEPPKKENETSKEVEELKAKLKEVEDNRTMVDDRVALMEKSYQMAAKYLPNNIQMSDKVKISAENIETVPVKNVTNNVVSSLGQISDIGFNTAVGQTEKIETKAIGATIYATKKVTSGQVVQLRLSEPMQVGDITIVKNTVITGIGEINGDRLNIKITSVNNNGEILPVKIEVYDTDGNLGIFIPNTSEMSAVKEMASNMGSTLGTSISITKNAGQQLATDLAKGVIQGGAQYLSNKFKTVRVTLKAGYKVMLLEKKE